MKHPHPAVASVLEASEESQLLQQGERWQTTTTSVSLAQALAIGCLSGLDPDQRSVKVWDPAAGTGFAGHLLVDALTSSGMEVDYRGQELNAEAAEQCEQRFSGYEGARIAVGDTLMEDLHPDFQADLVIVDAPWGLNWNMQEGRVKERHEGGEFRFGLPRKSDSTWLFVSLALEKLKAPEAGGGRVAALVAPSALSSASADSAIRESILEEGLLESVTWLPNGLAPNTQIDLYLLVFNNAMSPRRAGKVQIANLQTEFTVLRHKRSLKTAALRELESGLRKWKPGRLNRIVNADQFNRFEADVRKPIGDRTSLSWTITTYNNTPIDEDFLVSRYGEGHTVALHDSPKRIIDFDPRRIFKDETRALIKTIGANGFPVQRLSTLITAEPELFETDDRIDWKGHLFLPVSMNAPASLTPPDPSDRLRRVTVEVDQERVLPEFLEAWLNTDVGFASRGRALDVAASGTVIRTVRTEPRSILKWTDELFIPTPDLETQARVAALDSKLQSYQAELEALRSALLQKS